MRRPNGQIACMRVCPIMAQPLSRRYDAAVRATWLLVLICIDKTLNTHTAIVESGQFAVNILEQRQEHLSRRFATSENDKFTGVAWHAGRFGLPVLEGALAVIECQLRDTFAGGDHSIFVGEVMDAEISTGSPLLYYRRGYRELI